jgi:hypothetical protein
VSPPKAGRQDEQPQATPDRSAAWAPADADIGPQVDWAWLVATTIHPIRVAIIETLRTVDLPATATDIWNALGAEEAILQDLEVGSTERTRGLSQQRVIHHLKALEGLGALTIITTVPLRARRERHYVLTAALLGVRDDRDAPSPT